MIVGGVQTRCVLPMSMLSTHWWPAHFPISVCNDVSLLPPTLRLYVSLRLSLHPFPCPPHSHLYTHRYPSIRSLLCPYSHAHSQTARIHHLYLKPSITHVHAPRSPVPQAPIAQTLALAPAS
ncbi:hypothetical protein BDN70DRAFT_271126 [Pholiota conissans]|uniref:Uncharacterized protein n=1 Tax=Pholiota conissans TaxID=109636 RepID=A0A9P6CWF0_9AGAR|nr:hypothetical protein BDN70DRAFT_271126 [Pholiota conissans]